MSGRADRWLTACLAAGALVTWLSFVLALATDTGAVTMTDTIRRWSGAVLLVAAPFLVRVIVLKLDARNTPSWTVGAAWLLQLLPLALLSLDEPAVVVPAYLALGAINLFLFRVDDRAVAFAIGLGPLAVVAGFTLAPGVAWLGLFPTAVAIAAAALIALQARRSERLEAARPSSVSARASAVSAPSTGAEIAYALPLTALLLLVTFVVYIGVHVLPDPVFHSEDAVELGADQREGERSLEELDAQDTFGQIFPSGMDLAGGVSQLQRETVMVVTPEVRRDLGPLYMRGMVLDVLDETGATFGGRGGLIHTRTNADGWVELQPAQGSASSYEVSIVQQPILIRRGNRGILFTPERTLAVDRSSVQHDPDGLLIALDPEPDWFRFGTVVQERRAGYLDLAGARARHDDARFTALPTSRSAFAALERIRAEAERITRGAATDLDRILAIIRWFQDEFTYSLEATEFPGLAGVSEFLDKKRGPCTYYSSTATLMLRSLGLPARIATGFLAKDWDEEQGAYVVSTREGHAWVEVCFEGFDWVTFDPTPGQQRSAALERALAEPAEPDLRTWTAGLLASLREWAESGGEIDPMRDFIATLQAGPRAAWESAKAAPFLWTFGLAAVAVLAVLLRRARRSRPVPAGLPRRALDDRAASLYRQLLEALARRGFTKRPPQTLREFAGAVHGSGGVPYEPLPAIAELFYRARYGEAPLTPDEEATVRGYVRQLGERTEDSIAAT